MHAKELISTEIPALSPTDTIGRALECMEEFKVGDLPVVDRGRLLGLVHDGDLLELNDVHATLGSNLGKPEVPYVREGQHIFDVMKVLTERGLSVLPVVNEMGGYLGSITEHKALQELAVVTNIREPGSVVVLEMNQADYSLQEIARIVEGNDGKVLSVYISSLPGSTRTEVTLKINREDISGILQTFDRYEYFVKSSYQGSRFHEDLKERYEGLMRYINM